MVLQRILKRNPQHEVALYQLSQVYLEQNKTHLALECIKSAAQQSCQKKNQSKNVENAIPVTLGPEKMSGIGSASQHYSSSPPCLWGAKCTTKAQLCTQIIIQEADILRAMRQYKSAAQVCFLTCAIFLYEFPITMKQNYVQSQNFSFIEKRTLFIFGSLYDKQITTSSTPKCIRTFDKNVELNIKPPPWSCYKSACSTSSTYY